MSLRAARQPGLGPRLVPPLGGLAAVALALWGAPVSALSGTPSGLDAYTSAERALAGGDRAAFETLSQGLRAHPLYPYLRYAALARDADGAPDSDIEAFLAEYGDTPMAERLRAAYLGRLVGAGRWADYARVYREDGSTERRCLYGRALLATGRAQAALSDAALLPLWLVGTSQPAACDPLFSAWRAAGGLTAERVWARMRLAMESGKTGLARYLGALLPESERPWLDFWLAVESEPAKVLEPWTLGRDHPMAGAILGSGLARLASSSVARAADALELESSRPGAPLAADSAAWDRAHRAVGRALVRGSDPEGRQRGLRVWDRMSASPENRSAQEERLRAAIRLGDWQRVADWIGRMPESTEKDDRWLYWLGRAQAALGRSKESADSYARAAGQRSLWGFLAADLVGLPYRLERHAVPAEPERIRAIAGTPAFARIRALRALGRESDMRREWRTLTRTLDRPDLMAAAFVADVLGWHDQAIFTLARTGYWDDLALRFPLRYRDLVIEQSWQTGLPEDWIFAVIREESVFAPAVASGAGALGLMQLMPATARQVALDPALALGSGAGDLERSQILRPETNLALGSAYLARMRDRFGHPALATAAYNAGPNRVERWLPETCREADLWIAAIPFEETRGYVERVLAYRVIYSARLGGDPVRAADLLRPIAPREPRRAEPPPEPSVATRD